MTRGRAPGRTLPALDLDTFPKALAALVNLPEPGRLILTPFHGTSGQRPAAEPQGEPCRRWTWTPSRRPSRSSRPALDLHILPKALAALVNLPEPKPAAAGSRPRCRLGGRLHLDRPEPEPPG